MDAGIGVDIMEKQYQVFVTVDDEGNLISMDLGEMIVRTEPADFFFMVGEEIRQDLMEHAYNYRVVLNGYRASLVLKEEIGGGVE